MKEVTWSISGAASKIWLLTRDKTAVGDDPTYQKVAEGVHGVIAGEMLGVWNSTIIDNLGV